MAQVHLDTHLVVWLAMKEHRLIPEKVTQFIEDSDLAVSPVVLLEIQYLIENKRIEGNALKMMEALRRGIGLEVCQDSFEMVAKEAMGQSWTRDPFDRMIVAQAALTKTPLVTKDHTILKNYSKAFWG